MEKNNNSNSEKNLEQVAHEKINELNKNEDQLIKQKQRLQQLKEQLEQDKENQKDFLKCQETDDQDFKFKYLSDYIKGNQWPENKIDDHLKILMSLSEDYKKKIVTQILFKQLNRILITGSFTLEQIEQYFNKKDNKEAESKYHTERAYKQLFTWKNEYDQQPDEYLLEIIVKLQLKDKIKPEVGSFQLAESLLYEGLKERNKGKLPAALDYFQTAKKVLPNTKNNSTEQVLNNDKILKSQINFNCIIVMSFDRKKYLEIIEFWDNCNEEQSWVPDEQYFEYFGDVSDMQIIQRFFWDQAMAQYDIYGKSCQQLGHFQDTANAFEELIKFLQRRQGWYQEKADEKIQQIQHQLSSMYDQKKAKKGASSKRKIKKGSNQELSSCCNIF